MFKSNLAPTSKHKNKNKHIRKKKKKLLEPKTVINFEN